MIEQRMIVLVLAVVCCLCEVKAAAQLAVAQSHTSCSGDSASKGACIGSGAAESSSTGPDGITTGECSYTDPQGQSIKIQYREFRNGEVQADAGNPQIDAHLELQRCREAVKVGQQVAQENFEQVQAEHQKLQEELQNQQLLLQQQLFEQQRALFNTRNFPGPGNFPFPGGFNPIAFPNFPGAFRPQF